jgi:hypothetical protein
MARRATLDRGLPRDADDDSAAAGSFGARSGRPGRYSSSPEPGQPGGSRARGRQAGSAPWRGSGGRWLVWTLRVIAWAVLLVIGYRGVLAIIQGPGSSSSSPPPATATAPDDGFPVTVAEAYALQFGNAYLSFSPATASSRAQILSAMLPAGANSQLGWNGAGVQTVSSDAVAGIQVQSAHSAVVDLLAVINGGTPVELGVPVYASNGRLVITGEPALLPLPRTANPPATPAVPSTDPTATQELQNQLPNFFRAYADDQTDLSRFLVQGAQITSLNGAVTLNTAVPLTLTVPPGGSVRHITAVVSWLLPASQAPTGRHSTGPGSPATLEMTYDMTVVEQGGTWDVQSISAADQLPPGSP